LYMVNAVQHLLVAFLCSPEVGLSLTAAGLYSSLVFAASLVGKVVFGFALDRPRRRSYALCGCAMLAVGSGLTLRPSWSSAVGSGGGAGGGLAGGLRLATAGSHLQLSLFALTFGLGYGGTFTLVLPRAAQLYGGESDFAKLQSCLAAAQCEPTHSDAPPPRSFRASFASHPRLFAPASALPSYARLCLRPPDLGMGRPSRRRLLLGSDSHCSASRPRNRLFRSALCAASAGWVAQLLPLHARLLRDAGAATTACET
jgi:hypothetical protein